LLSSTLVLILRTQLFYIASIALSNFKTLTKFSGLKKVL